MSTVAQNLHDWQAQQATIAYREDQQRVTAPTFPTFYAVFQGESGVAYRDAQEACWFLSDDGATLLLHDIDSSHLILLGRLDVAKYQQALDEQTGSLFQLIDNRNSEKAAS